MLSEFSACNWLSCACLTWARAIAMSSALGPSSSVSRLFWALTTNFPPVLQSHDVNPWWFLLIDVGTAPFYGLGQAMGVKLMRDETRPMRCAMPWIAMLFVSFVAPYAYLLASAGKLPGYVVAGVVVWMMVFGAMAAFRMMREVRLAPVGEPVVEPVI